MPLWHNINMIENNYLWNKRAAKCLKNTHQIKTIGDLAEYRMGQGINCGKEACRNMADKIWEEIPAIINPNNQTPRKTRQLDLDHTPRRILMNQTAKMVTVFNPDITERHNALNQVRINGDKTKATKRRKSQREPREPAHRPTTIVDSDEEEDIERVEREKIIIWIITAAENHKYENGRTWMTIYYGEDDERNRNRKLGPGHQSTERAYIVALQEVAQRHQLEDVEIRLTSKKIIQMINKGARKGEDDDWIGIEMHEDCKILLQILRNREAKMQVALITKRSHEIKLIKKIKKRLWESKETITSQAVIRQTDTDYANTGAKLQTISQKTAYQLALKKNAKNPINEKTRRRLEVIKAEIETRSNVKPTDQMLFKKIKDVTPYRISDFLWKIIHGRIKCGAFFRYIPEWSEKEFCKCGETESISHILFNCETNHTRLIWIGIARLYKKVTGQTMRTPSITTLAGIGCLKIQHRGKERPEWTEIYKTLIITACWCIWKARNRRIFRDEETGVVRLLEEIGQELHQRIEIDFDWIKTLPNGKKKGSQVSKFIRQWCLNKVMAVVDTNFTTCEIKVKKALTRT
ncbi:hypothetical protein CPB83DRAFT_865575 [Crepidotus variabilis]|uniref:Reverse transcriptase zinc-binding domain-containing protein n=1 Tax=Crepidotus variabilis TaxID=179855 RepID=A0A9P6E2I0_9AGAR|nr:hypothetical protein CPB83DRAFT_865575 [Crepidotus variabilis]